MRLPIDVDFTGVISRNAVWEKSRQIAGAMSYALYRECGGVEA
jgi:hypothetical protein